MLERRERRFDQTLPSDAGSLSLVLFGIECEFTRIILERLVGGGVPVSLVCLPGPASLEEPIVQRPPSRPNISLFQPPSSTVSGLAHNHGVDVWRVGDLRARPTVERFIDLKADLAVVACFNRLIPRVIVSSFRLGAVNVHPSLLPDKRGPDPQFWTFKQGMAQAGITIHQLTNRFDAGPVLAREPVVLADGATETELDQRTAAAGARLLIDLIPRLAAGDACPTPQDESKATYAPHPARSDFRLDRSGPARVAFNFVRGIQARGVPVLVEIDVEDWVVDEAVAYWDGESAIDHRPGDGETLIAFNPGFLLARIRAVEPE